MSMRSFRAQQLWPQQLDIAFGSARVRSPVAAGTVGCRFVVKLFPPSGRSEDFEGNPNASSTDINARVTNVVLISSGRGSRDSGYHLQAWWTFQYDLDIAQLTVAGQRVPEARAFRGCRVAGLHNIIQSFDIVPSSRPGGAYAATYRTMRGDSRPSGAGALWEWQFSHDRTVRNAGSGPNIVTSTLASLPVRYSGTLSAGASEQLSATMGWNIGPTVSATGGGGLSQGASLNLSFGRTLELRMIGSINLIARS